MTDGLDTSGELRQAADAVATIDDLALLLRTLRQRRPDRTPASYRDVAAATGWSPSIVGAYLKGKALPPADRFDRLVRLFGAAPDEIGPLRAARDRVDEGRAGRAGQRPEPGPEPVARQLPGDIPAFTGRADALATLDRLLRPGSAPRTVVISAVSGRRLLGSGDVLSHGR